MVQDPVLAVNDDDGTYFLRYEDGDEWERVPADRIRLPTADAFVASADEPMRSSRSRRRRRRRRRCGRHRPHQHRPRHGGGRGGSGAPPAAAAISRTPLSSSSSSSGSSKPQVLHAVVSQAVNAYLDELPDAPFKPRVVKYSNTNPDIKDDGSHGERIDWKVSSYMEVDTTTGGAKSAAGPRP